MSRVSQWHWTEWGQDWSQTRAINELDEQLALQRASHQRQLRRSRRDFEQVQTGLKQVDARLTDRIDTVLAWTELRFQLLEFDEYAARKEIRKSFRALAGGMPAAGSEIDDVSGYWLPPAAVSMLGLLLRRGTADLNSGLETARERDPMRAELFNLCVGICFDQRAFSDVAVLRLIDEDPDLGLAEPGEVAAGWRALWEHTALGEFGPGAADLLENRLRGLFDLEALDEDQAGAWDDAILGFGAHSSAAEALGALAAHLEEAGRSAPLGAGPEPDERWRRYLQELIEEPSPAELPLVQEMEELHLPDDELQRSEPTWSRSEGTVSALLRRDLFDPDASPALRGLALRLCAPLLRSRIEHLAGETESEAHPSRVVKRAGFAIEVDRDGHDAAELEAAERRLAIGYELDAPSRQLAIGIAAGLGLLTAVSAGFGNWFLAVLFTFAIAVPVWYYRGARSRQARNQAFLDDKMQRLRAELDTAKEQVLEDEAARDRRLAAIGAAREAVLSELPSGSGDTPRS